MLDNEFPIENAHWVDCPMPQEAENLHQLQEICDAGKIGCPFYITTPRYTDLEYVTRRSEQIPNLETSLHLAALQPQFHAFKANDFQKKYSELVDWLLGTFSFINVDLTNFFITKADDAGAFSWEEKYGPCFFDRERFSAVRDWIIGLEMQSHRHDGYSSIMEDTAKAILMRLLYLCGFLAFWVCLADVLTFPGCDEREKEVLENLAAFMLANYANVYVYNTVVESNPLKGGSMVLNRGSAENTTRIKLYLTKEDGTPVLLRLDLPHEGHPYVHLNIEDDTNKHIPLSKDAQGNEYDHVFDNLEKALLRYNFNVTEYVHSPVAQDKIVIKDMRYRTALLNYAPCSFYYMLFLELGIDQDPEGLNEPFIIRAHDTLVELLAMDGYRRDELVMLAPPDLLEMAYKSLLD